MKLPADLQQALESSHYVAERLQGLKHLTTIIEYAAHVQSDLAALERRITQLQHEIQTLEQVRQEMKGANALLEGQVTKYRQEHHLQLEQVREKKAAAMKELEQQEEAAQQSLRDVRSECHAAQAEVKQALHERDEIRRAIGKLGKHIETLTP